MIWPNRVIAVAMAAVLVGCAQPDQFTSDLAKFSSAATNFADRTESLLVASDRTQFDLEVARSEYGRCGTQARTRGACPLDGRVINTSLLTPADMAARKSALSTLKAYAAALSKACAATPGADFASAVTSLQQQVNTVGSDVAKMTGKGGNLKELEQASGPIAILVGTIGKMVIEQKQADALIEAILSAEQPIGRLADNMDKDMAIVLADMGDGATGQYGFAVEAYNDLLPAKMADRQALLAIVKGKASAYYELRTIRTSYSQSIGGFKAAVSELASFARSKRDPKKYADVVAAVDVFISRAEDLNKAIGQVRK